MRHRTTSKDDVELMTKLLDELTFQLPEHFNGDTRSFWATRLLEAHAAVPLNLAAMFEAAKAGGAALTDVTHDLGGIRNHWDGEKFTDCFSPRFAVRQ
jgi:hypothetical protein